MGKKIINNHCYVCKGDMRFLMKGIDINYTATGKSFDICRCKKCGLEQIYPLLSQEKLLEYYPKNYYSYDTKEKQGYMERIIYRTLDDIINKKISFFSLVFKNRIGKFPLKKKPEGNYLDIGCGAGKHLKIIEKYGWNSYGFEIGVKNKIEKIIYNTHIKYVDRGNKKFDFISLWAVFEHLLDPIGYIETIKKILKNSGELHIFVPNNNSVYAKIFGPYRFNRDIPRHIFNYNPTALKILFTQQGFKIKEINHLSAGGFFTSLYQYLKCKFGLNIGFLNNIGLHIVFYPIDWIINKLGFGDNIHLTIKIK
ncbi:class I SAM-dependent methyltransferase [Candidatus Gracilibacteria bacterium]|nr:class I SAM-dependent methyltransferase [Candidatus Gracilibacteria bacterium]